MPLQKLQFRPGLNREGTDYSNEGGWYDGDKVRFRSGFPEKIGGWTKFATVTFLGVCRSLWNWLDLSNNNFIGVGTNVKYYIEKGGVYNDITPLLTNTSGSTTTTLGVSPLATQSGSSTVTVTDTISGIAPNIGDYVILTSTATVGGLTISGEYVITKVINSTQFQITASTTASSTATGGGTVTLQYEYPTGGTVYTTSNGWGAGSWSPTIPVTLGINPFSISGGSNIVTVTQTAHGYLTTAGAFVIGQQYKIVAIGSTDFTLIGASANTVGTVFTATGVGTGSGTASIVWVSFAGAIDIAATTTVYGFSGTTGLSTGTYGFSGHSTTTPVPATLLNSTFQITYVDANTYTITIAATAPYAGVGGGSNVVVYPQYGTRPWGAAANVGIGSQLRLWSNDNYGQNLFIAPRGGAIYYWLDANGVTSRAQSLQTLAYSTSAGYVPNSTYQVVTSAIQRFVIAFGANSYVSGSPNTPFNPMLVRWSDQANEYQWVPAITNQSGEFALTNGSYIMGARATRQEILVWTDSAIYSMQYLGAPYVWGFQLLMDNISVISPNSMITVNNVTYWMGIGKFYMYSGRVETLPCSLRQYIFDDINQDQAYQIFAGANEAYNEVWWFYVSNSSQNTVIDKYVIYNYLDRVWYYGSMSRTAWLETGIQQYPIAAQYTPNATFVGSINGTTLNVTSLTSGSITLDATLVGEGVVAGTQVVGYINATGNTGTYLLNISQTVAATSMTIFGNTGQLLNHENGVDDVSGLTARAIDSYVQSSDFDIGDGHNFGFVWRILPDVNFNGSNVGNPAVTMTIKPRENSGTAYGVADNPSVISSQVYNNKVSVYNVQQFTGQVYTRLRGRQMAFRIESNTIGVAWQLGSPRMDIRPDGRR